MNQIDRKVRDLIYAGMIRQLRLLEVLVEGDSPESHARAVELHRTSMACANSTMQAIIFERDGFGFESPQRPATGAPVVGHAELDAMTPTDPGRALFDDIPVNEVP